MLRILRKTVIICVTSISLLLPNLLFAAVQPMGLAPQSIVISGGGGGSRGGGPASSGGSPGTSGSQASGSPITASTGQVGSTPATGSGPSAGLATSGSGAGGVLPSAGREALGGAGSASPVGSSADAPDQFNSELDGLFPSQSIPRTLRTADGEVSNPEYLAAWRNILYDANGSEKFVKLAAFCLDDQSDTPFYGDTFLPASQRGYMRVTRLVDGEATGESKDLGDAIKLGWIEIRGHDETTSLAVRSLDGSDYKIDIERAEILTAESYDTANLEDVGFEAGLEFIEIKGARASQLDVWAAVADDPRAIFGTMEKAVTAADVLGSLSAANQAARLIKQVPGPALIYRHSNYSGTSQESNRVVMTSELEARELSPVDGDALVINAAGASTGLTVIIPEPYELDVAIFHNDVFALERWHRLEKWIAGDVDYVTDEAEYQSAKDMHDDALRGAALVTFGFAAAAMGKNVSMEMVGPDLEPLAGGWGGGGGSVHVGIGVADDPERDPRGSVSGGGGGGASGGELMRSFARDRKRGESVAVVSLDQPGVGRWVGSALGRVEAKVRAVAAVIAGVFDRGVTANWSQKQMEDAFDMRMAQIDRGFDTLRDAGQAIWNQTDAQVDVTLYLDGQRKAGKRIAIYIDDGGARVLFASAN